MLKIAFSNIEDVLVDVYREQFQKKIYKIFIILCVTLVLTQVFHLHLYFDLQHFKSVMGQHENKIIDKIDHPPVFSRKN